MRPVRRTRLVPMRLAIAAMIARHARFDQARPVGGRQLPVLIMARGRRELEQRVGIGLARRVARGHPREGLADERPQRILVHAPTSTVSMMPMIAASTAAAFLPSASPAALP